MNHPITPANALAEFDACLATQLRAQMLQALWRFAQLAKRLGNPSVMMSGLSFLCDIRDLGEPQTVFEAVLEVDRLCYRIEIERKPMDLMRLLNIRSKAVERCRR